jgi:hypothetical protein
MSDIPGYGLVRLRPGVTLDSRPGEEARYRATTRIRFPEGRLNQVDEASGADLEQRRGNYLAPAGLALPFTAPCSHGAHQNKVSEATLRVL